MKKQLQDLTVFLISTNNINYQDTKQALLNQSVSFEINEIKNYSPMNVAFQEMLNRCKTKYYIQCDEDMVLYKNSVEIMYNEICKSEKNISFLAYALQDVHLDRWICGIKIYKYEIMKKYPYVGKVSCEMNQVNEMKKDGYNYKFYNTIVGKHSPKWNNYDIFVRYFDLWEKYKIFKYKWVEKLPIQLLDKIKNDPKSINIFAFLGLYTSLIGAEKPVGEKDFKNKMKTYELLIQQLKK